MTDEKKEFEDAKILQDYWQHEYVQGKTNSMIAEMEKQYPLPPRFKAERHDVAEGPAMTITDTKSDYRTQVTLFSYGEVRLLLNDLFCEEPNF